MGTRRVLIGLLVTAAVALMLPTAPAAAQPGDTFTAVLFGRINWTGAGCNTSALLGVPPVDLLEGPPETCTGQLVSLSQQEGVIEDGLATAGAAGLYAGSMVCAGSSIPITTVRTLLRGVGSFGPAPITPVGCRQIIGSILTCVQGEFIREGLITMAGFGFGSSATIPGCPNATSHVGGVQGFGPSGLGILVEVPFVMIQGVLVAL